MKGEIETVDDKLYITLKKDHFIEAEVWVISQMHIPRIHPNLKRAGKIHCNTTTTKLFKSVHVLKLLRRENLK